MQDFLYFFGHGFCHQLPSRTFEVGGLFFSACARDTGIYLGFFFAVLAAFIIYAKTREKPAELPPVTYLILLALFVVPMGIDGVSSYAGLRPTTNTIRYITGFLTGMAGGSIVAPLLFALRADAAPDQKIFAKPSHVALHLLVTFALGAIFFFAYPYLGVLSALFGVVAFISILMSVNVILVTLIKSPPPAQRAGYWFLVLLVCLVLTLVEITLFGLLREFMVDTLLQGRDLGEFLR
jgi:uncharacterized membrane protein